MKVFSVIMGLTKIEFAVYKIYGGYEARINNVVMFTSPDYDLARETIIDSLEIDNPYVGLTH